MAGWDLATIRSAIAANVKAAVKGAQCSGYLLDQPTTPSFELAVHPDGIDYDLAMSRGLDKVVLLLRGFVSSGFDVSSQKRLDGWMKSTGGESVKAAIEVRDGPQNNVTLGGLVQDCQVTHVTEPRTFTVSGVSNAIHIGAEWTIELLATGD